MNRKCRQNVAIDDRRTFTDKDKAHRIQTLGNDNKDSMLDCESGSHHSEDKRKLNCHKLKVLANEDALLRTQCCYNVSRAVQTGKHLLRTQNVSEQNQKHFLCPGHKIYVRNKRGNICVGSDVSATMCPRLPGPLGLVM